MLQKFLHKDICIFCLFDNRCLNEISCSGAVYKYTSQQCTLVATGNTNTHAVDGGTDIWKKTGLYTCMLPINSALWWLRAFQNMTNPPDIAAHQTN